MAAAAGPRCPRWLHLMQRALAAPPPHTRHTPAAGTALLALRDALDDAGRSEVDKWVEAGEAGAFCNNTRYGGRRWAAAPALLACASTAVPWHKQHGRAPAPQPARGTVAPSLEPPLTRLAAQPPAQAPRAARAAPRTGHT